jgi:hypothetical protein
MANASNAYATINPIKTNIGDVVQGIEQMDFAYREEERKIDALEKARKEKEQAKKDKLREQMMGQIPKNYDTGSSSLNEFQAKIIQQGVNRLGEIYKDLNNPNLSEDDRIKLEIEAQNIDDLPNKLKISTDNFSKQINDYKTGVANGLIFPNPDFEKKVLNGFENYVGVLDNGLPAVGFVDRNADGTINNLDVLPYDQLQQGIGNWEFQKQFDLDTLAKNTGEKLATTEVQTDSNFVKRTIKTPDLKALDSLADNLMVNADGTPKEVALSELRKRKLPPTPENLLKVKQIFKENVLAYTDTSDKTDKDYSAQTGRMAENRQAKKDAEDKIVTTTIKINNTALGNDARGGVPISKKGILENGLNLGKGIKFDTIGGAKTGLDNSVVTNIFINDKNEIIFTANVLTEKASKEEKESFTESGTTTNPAAFRSETRKATGATEAKIANELGYSNADELKAELREMNKNTSKPKIDY